MPTLLFHKPYGVLSQFTDRGTEGFGDDDRWASAIQRSGAEHVEVAPLLSAAPGALTPLMCHRC